jgi:hypothetical protein
MLEIHFEAGQGLAKTDMTDIQQDISLSTTVVACTESNLSCDLKGDTVILNLESGVYFGMNPLGARIWELMQRAVKVSDVQRELLKEYDIDPVDCERDLLKFLASLRVHKLITVCTVEVGIL